MKSDTLEIEKKEKKLF